MSCFIASTSTGPTPGRQQQRPRGRRMVEVVDVDDVVRRRPARRQSAARSGRCRPRSSPRARRRRRRGSSAPAPSGRARARAARWAGTSSKRPSLSCGILREDRRVRVDMAASAGTRNAVARAAASRRAAASLHRRGWDGAWLQDERRQHSPRRRRAIRARWPSTSRLGRSPGRTALFVVARRRFGIRSPSERSTVSLPLRSRAHRLRGTIVPKY